ncbi:MAG: glutaminyl-peptide cyclotransferase [Candidatus Bathyarchaeia archaeon]|jgi:glutamine cyclotransferase
MAKKPFATSLLLVALILLLCISLIMVSLNQGNPNDTSASKTLDYSILNTYPHDHNAFTEGLIYSDGFLYESTGLNGFSTLRQVDLQSGEIQRNISLPDQFFGEGLTIVDENLIQLTYRSHMGFVYDKTSFALLRNFTYPTQGWGLTYDGTFLIMSDGSSTLHFLNSTTFEEVAQVHVQDGNTAISKLNELEYVNGEVYANIFEQSTIAVINPETGQVKAWIDLTELQKANRSKGEDVLNGIAYDAANDRLFVTGKFWSRLYEVKLVWENN